MRRTDIDDEDKTAAFEASFVRKPSEEPARSAWVFNGREESVATQPVEDHRVGTGLAPQQLQHSRAIHELLPQWMR